MFMMSGPAMTMNGTMGDFSDNNSYEAQGNNVTSGKDFLYYQIRIFQIIIYSAICFLGIMGNGLVIWFGLVKMEKTVNVVWFLNLAINDFTFVMVLPFNITSIVLDNNWPFGDFMCKFTWFLLYFNMATSVLQLMVISVDRCVCVVFPIWSRNHRTRQLALIVVLLIWVISVALTLPSYILRRAVGTSHISCTLHTRKPWIPITRFFLFFLVPCLVITSCYTIIILRIKDKSIIKSSKPFKVIVAVVIAFFVCWFPYNFVILYRIFQPNYKTNNLYRIGREISRALILFSSCINPILYVFIGQDFTKQKICGSFQSMLEKVFTEDMVKTQRENGKTLRSIVHPPTLCNTSAV